MTKFNKKPKTHTKNEQRNVVGYLTFFGIGTRHVPLADDIAMKFMKTVFELDTQSGRRRTQRNFPEFDEV